MRAARRLRAGAAVAPLILLLSTPARANERHFAYTYESATLPAGTAEIEPWTTWRVGRDQFYNAFDHRLEFEYGLTDRLMTALYINFSSASFDTAMNERESEFEYEGISSEWKYQLLDPVADAVGLAAYAEFTAAPQEFELEGKVIVDKRVGDLLFAANAVFEPEWELEQEETEVEYEIEADIGVGYFVADNVSLGLELRNHNEVHDGELEHSAFFLGPTVSYAQDSYWLALSVMPQVGAIDGEAAGDDIRDLAEHEALNARLLLGFHL